MLRPVYLSRKLTSRRHRATRLRPLMRTGLHDVSDDSFLAELLARLQTMQPFHQDETFAVLPHQDRALQADLEDALGDLLRFLGVERRAPFHRHVDVGDRERLALHHGWQPGVSLLSPCTCSGRLLRTLTRRIRSPCCCTRAARGHTPQYGRRLLRCGISIQLMSRWLAADMGLAGYRDCSECATVGQSCLGSRSSNTATGYELWCLCNDHLLFHQSHNARPIFCCCHAGTTCKGAV
jgi:hypothetical protein